MLCLFLQTIGRIKNDVKPIFAKYTKKKEKISKIFQRKEKKN